MTDRDERYCLWLSRHFFARGHEPEDLAQEARLAMLTAPGCRRLAARRQVLDLVKVANRRGFHATEYSDFIPDPGDVGDLVESRERLRGIVAAPRTANEREAVGRALRGEPIRRHEKALQVALYRVRVRLEACAA